MKDAPSIDTDGELSAEEESELFAHDEFDCGVGGARRLALHAYLRRRNANTRHLSAGAADRSPLPPRDQTPGGVVVRARRCRP